MESVFIELLVDFGGAEWDQKTLNTYSKRGQYFISFWWGGGPGHVGGGVCLFPSWGNTQAPGPLPPRGLGASYTDFLATSLPFFFASFFQCRFLSLLVDLRPQLDTGNPPKSVKNRCQDASFIGLPFLMHVCSICAPNFDPLDLTKHGFSYGNNTVF